MVPPCVLTRSGAWIRLNAAEIGRTRAAFAADHAVRLPALIAADLLQLVQTQYMEAASIFEIAGQAGLSTIARTTSPATHCCSSSPGISSIASRRRKAPWPEPSTPAGSPASPSDTCLGVCAIDAAKRVKLP